MEYYNVAERGKSKSFTPAELRVFVTRLHLDLENNYAFRQCQMPLIVVAIPACSLLLSLGVLVSYDVLKSPYLTFDPRDESDQSLKEIFGNVVANLRRMECGCACILSRSCDVERFRRCSREHVNGESLSIIDFEDIFDNLGEDDSLPPPSRTSPPSSDPSHPLSHVAMTSGTTKSPRLTLHSRKSMSHYVKHKNELLRCCSSSVVLIASNAGFDPCLGEIVSTFEANGTMVIVGGKQASLLEPREFCALVKATKITHIMSTPLVFSSLTHGISPDDPALSSLSAIALGGERLPNKLCLDWAVSDSDSDTNHKKRQLINMYGLTEACIYQVMGVVQPSDSISDNIIHCGVPLGSIEVSIDAENNNEIIMKNGQLDSYSDFPDNNTLRTGDRGEFMPSGNLVIHGRIDSSLNRETKISGVRINLDGVSETLKSAFSLSPIVNDCCVIATSGMLVCFVVTAPEFSSPLAEVVSQTSLLFLLLSLSAEKYCKKNHRPSLFLSQSTKIPTRRGGEKRDFRSLISTASNILDSAFLPNSPTCNPTSLTTLETVVYEEIRLTLNLQPAQVKYLTPSSRFADFGGDSLSATRIVRGIYARHHKLEDNRFLGGDRGEFGGCFDAVHLITAPTLGDYTRFLESHQICSDNENGDNNVPPPPSIPSATTANTANTIDDRLSSALMDAIMTSSASFARAFLTLGANPNHNAHNGKIGKLSDRRERKKLWSSSAVHLACSRGDPVILQMLLEFNAKVAIPDAAGNFPLQLAAGGAGKGMGSQNVEYNDEGDENVDDTKNDLEGENRVKCVKLLLEAGCVPTSKDANKHTLIHAAARAGQPAVLSYAIELLADEMKIKDNKNFGIIDWKDRWKRTPLHWACLNSHAECVEILLSKNADRDPMTTLHQRTKSRTSLVYESPLEIVERLNNVQLAAIFDKYSNKK